MVAENGKSYLEHRKAEHINQFNIDRIEASHIVVEYANKKIPVIEALDGELITNRIDVEPKISGTAVVSDTENDILKIVVVNRYSKAKPAVAFIKNFGLQQGALASSVGHDSHNVIAVGVDDESIADAINMIIDKKGGLAAVDSTEKNIIPLPIAGLMTDEDGYQIAQDYIALDQQTKRMGSKLGSPFMTLSFMALLVIPSLKLSDLGLFDGNDFKFVET